MDPMAGAEGPPSEARTLAPPPVWAPGGPAPFSPGSPYALPLLPPPGQDTFRGLRSLRWGTKGVIASVCIFLVAHLFLLLQAVYLRNGLASLDLPTLEASDRWFALAVVVAVVGAIAAIVGVLIGIAGFFFVGRGQREFGDTHSKSVTRGISLLTLACVIELALFLYRLSSVPSLQALPADADLADLLVYLDRWYASVVVEALLVLFVTLSSGLAMVAAVSGLMTAQGRRRSAGFLGLSLLPPACMLLVASVLPAMVGPVGGNANDPMAMLAGLSSIANASVIVFNIYIVADFLSVLALVWYLGLLRSAKRGARNMIATGLYDPNARPAVSDPAPAWPLGSGP